MKLFYILSVFSLSLILLSCQKEKSFESNGTTTTNSSGDYFPRTAGSNWSYVYDNNASDTLYITATGNTINVNGNAYIVFMQRDSTSYDTAGYYRKSGNDYYSWDDAGSFLGFDSSLWVENNFLKDNLAAGSTWANQPMSGTVTGIGRITIRYKYTILQKDATVTVNGTSYANTIVTEQRVEQNNGSGWVDISSTTGTIRYYYARDKGEIKEELYNGSGGLIHSFQVRRLTVY
jgi:hypothetical protein